MEGKIQHSKILMKYLMSSKVCKEIHYNNTFNEIFTQNILEITQTAFVLNKILEI